MTSKETLLEVEDLEVKSHEIDKAAAEQITGGVSSATPAALKKTAPSSPVGAGLK